jgi:hypothetical protein
MDSVPPSVSIDSSVAKPGSSVVLSNSKPVEP